MTIYREVKKAIREGRYDNLTSEKWGSGAEYRWTIGEETCCLTSNGILSINKVNVRGQGDIIDNAHLRKMLERICNKELGLKERLRNAKKPLTEAQKLAMKELDDAVPNQ